MRNISSAKLKKGMTLIEVVVSLAILTLITVFIISVYVVALKVVSENALIKKKDKDAAAGIENTMGGFAPDSSISTVNKQSGNFSINFGGATVNVDGEFITGRDNDAHSKYYYFSPGSD